MAGRSTTRKDSTLVVNALDMAAFDASGDLTGLTHHSDHGSNSSAMVYTDRIMELGAIPSTGTVGDSYDCQSVPAGFRKNQVVLAGTV